MMLGRLFEPYVRHIVGFLLDRHSDPNVNVRQAAVDASRMIMSQLTGHGVKQVLPDLLEKLQVRRRCRCRCRCQGWLVQEIVGERSKEELEGCC